MVMDQLQLMVMGGQCVKILQISEDGLYNPEKAKAEFAKAKKLFKKQKGFSSNPFGCSCQSVK